MNKTSFFRKEEIRTFYAHHMLLHASLRAIEEAKSEKIGRFNKCLSAMVMSALAVEGLLNAVGHKLCTEHEWPIFESKRPREKIDAIVERLSIAREEKQEPWTTITFLNSFRNNIAHPKPESIEKVLILPSEGIERTKFDRPESKIEKIITPRNAERCYEAVMALKLIFHTALPKKNQSGIYAETWIVSETIHEK